MAIDIEAMDPVDRLFISFPLGGGNPIGPDDTPELRREYREALADIEPEKLKRVVRRLVDTCDTFPTVAEVRGKYGELFLGQVKRDPEFEQALGRLQMANWPTGAYDDADWLVVHAGVRARVKERLITRQISHGEIASDPHYVARECYRVITGSDLPKEVYP